MKEIIICSLLNYLIVIIIGFIYFILGLGTVDQFVNGPCVYIVLIFYVVTFIILYLKNKRIERRISCFEIVPFVSFGFSLSIFLNMLIFLFHDSNYVSYSFPTYYFKKNIT